MVFHWVHCGTLFCTIQAHTLAHKKCPPFSSMGITSLYWPILIHFCFAVAVLMVMKRFSTLLNTDGTIRNRLQHVWFYFFSQSPSFWPFHLKALSITVFFILVVVFFWSFLQHIIMEERAYRCCPSSNSDLLSTLEVRWLVDFLMQHCDVFEYGATCCSFKF